MSSGNFPCRDVRVKDGNIDRLSVRVENVESPPPPEKSSSAGKGGKNKSSRKRSKGKESQRPADPLPTRAAPGWLAISGRQEESGPSLTPSSTNPSSSAAPPSSTVDADVLRKRLEEQQKFLTQFFENQQKWANNMEAEAQKRNLQLGRAADELEEKEKKLIEKSRRLKRSLKGAASSDPQHSSNSPAMPPLVPRETPSDPSSEWSGDSSSSSSLSACHQD